MIILYLLLIAIASGVLGRMGGAQGYDTKYRDVGCSILAVFGLCLFVPFSLKFWWVYLIIFGLHWGAFSTYWDWLFGFDNLWFSGFVVGVAMMPACFILPWLWWVLLIRAILLAVVWGVLNKCLPPKVLFWRRDVTEEFSRYAVSL